jgi:hypothetical protein
MSKITGQQIFEEICNDVDSKQISKKRKDALMKQQLTEKYYQLREDFDNTRERLGFSEPLDCTYCYSQDSDIYEDFSHVPELYNKKKVLEQFKLLYHRFISVDSFMHK